MPREPRWNVPSPEEMDKQLEEIRLGTSAIIARLLNKRISFPISKWLVHTWVTPHQLTTLHLIMGLVACGMLAAGTWFWMIMGGILFWFSTVLDGCDGEIAKLRGTSTNFGRWFDTLSDVAKSLILFPCLAIGLNKLIPDSYPWMWFAVILFISGIWSSAMIVVLTTGRRSYGNFQLVEIGYDKVLFSIPILGSILKYAHYMIKFDFFAFFLMIFAFIGRLDIYLICCSILGAGMALVTTGLAIYHVKQTFLSSAESNTNG